MPIVSYFFNICLLILFFSVTFTVPNIVLGQDEVLTVGVLEEHPPYSFTQRGTARGIAVDIGLLLGKAMHVRTVFKGINADNISENLVSRNIDIACCVFSTHELENQFDIIDLGISTHRRLFVHKSCRTVTCFKDLNQQRILFVQGDPFEAELASLQGATLIAAESPQTALSMLDKGEADVYVARSEAVAVYLIQREGLKNIIQVGMPLETVSFVLVVGKDQNSDLLKRISIAYGKLSEKNSLKLIQEKWLGKSVSSERWARYSRYVTGAIAFIALILGLVSFWGYLLKRRVRRVTADLQRSEQSYRDLIESSPDMIFVVTETGKIVQANAIAKSKWDLARLSDPPNIKDFVSPENVLEVRAFLDEVFERGCGKYEFLFRLESEDELHVEIAGTPMKGGDGMEALACLFARDVSERNRMEYELIQTERLATIGKMAASVAHEINNPLGIILANAEELLFDEKLDGDTRHALKTIQRSATRAGEITEELLSLSSPQPLAKEVLDLEEVVREAASLLGPQLNKKVDFSIVFPEAPILVRGDTRSLQQVVVNLILNSLDSLGGKGSIVVAGRMDDGHGQQPTARIVIKDTGKGIPREDLTKVFDPFFTGKKRGFGLGLFICRRIVERHGGIIFAESEVGKSTRMIVELPALSDRE